MKTPPTTLNFEIKPLNVQEYSAAPEEVRRVYISVMEKIPLSTAVLKATIKAYPEYFTMKPPEVKKTFGQNVKRLFALKGALVMKKKKKPGKNPFPWGRKGTNLDPLPLDFIGKVTDILYVKKEDVVFPPACNGNCGMNYCDDNGCIDRKRELVDPDTNLDEANTVTFQIPNPNG